MEGVEEDSVDWRDNYSGDTREPIVMPSAVPNLLANGAQGIAVGMATSIPPHNIAELCDAALHLIAHPKADMEALTQYVQGPDFPTGGVCDRRQDGDRRDLPDRPRRLSPARPLDEEDAGRGRWVAVVTEIPYSVKKSRLIEQIADLLNQRKLPLLADVRDESTEDVRIVLEPKTRTSSPSADGVALPSDRARDAHPGEHERAGRQRDAEGGLLSDALQAMARPPPGRAGPALALPPRGDRHRLELLAGMIIVFLNLDEVIRIVREEDEPKEALKSRFGLSDLQAVYILDTRLRSLRRLEEMALRKEQDDLTKEKASIERSSGTRRSSGR